MTERYTHHRNTIECVDKDPESIAGSAASINGALFYHVDHPPQIDRGTHHKPPGDLGRQPIASLRLEWQGSQGHLLQSPLHPRGKDAVGFTSMAPPPCVHLPLLLCTRKALDRSTLTKLNHASSKLTSTVFN